MLEHDRIDISEGIDVNKIRLSNECDICHYWYFSMNHNIVFKYEPYLCNDCHDLIQKDLSFNNVSIFHVKGSVYRIHFWHMSKDGAINTMNDSNLVDKRSVL